MKIAIIGETLSGKTTLFNALTGGHGTKGGKYFSSIGSFISRDRRVFELGTLAGSKKITPISFEIADFDGFGRLWNEDRIGEIAQKLLPYDLLIQVIPAFSGETPKDIKNAFTELDLKLIFHDLKILENRIERLRKEVQAKQRDPKELQTLEKVYNHLLEEKPINTLKLDQWEERILKGYGFLTLKPRIVMINLSEEQIMDFSCENIFNYPLLCASFKIEEEIALLDEEERVEFLKAYGIEDSIVHKLEDTILKQLGYIVFYTVGEKETRAWLLKKGSTVYEAAGKIHTDIQRGFVKAEVIAYEDFLKAGSHKKARQLNLMHLEGKNYIVQDGDIINIRFSI